MIGRALVGDRTARPLITAGPNELLRAELHRHQQAISVRCVAADRSHDDRPRPERARRLQLATGFLNQDSAQTPCKRRGAGQSWATERVRLRSMRSSCPPLRATPRRRAPLPSHIRGSFEMHPSRIGLPAAEGGRRGR